MAVSVYLHRPGGDDGLPVGLAATATISRPIRVGARRRQLVVDVVSVTRLVDPRVSSVFRNQRRVRSGVLDALFCMAGSNMSGSTLKPSGASRAMPLTQQLSPGGASAGGTDSLISKLAGEMAERWHAGERPQAEEFLSRHPELCGQSDIIVRLIYEEICLRQEIGQESASIEVVQRFPQWRQQLEDILCHPSPRGPSLPHFPAVGETLGGFRMLAELGHGIRGRVYL